MLLVGHRLSQTVILRLDPRTQLMFKFFKNSHTNLAEDYITLKATQLFQCHLNFRPQSIVQFLPPTAK